MPDRRSRRGPHPSDGELFARDQHVALATATAELSWLLTRGYAETASLKLVGDRHDLTARQREAVARSACSDQALASRAARQSGLDAGIDRLVIDGLNQLITIESALSGGVVLVGRDGCCRDLASIHGTYRKVAQTPAAIRLVGQLARDHGVGQLDWLLDRPVSNSGRLAALIEAELGEMKVRTVVSLVDDPDSLLVAESGIIATSDGPVLDRAGRWLGLAGEVITRHVPDAWRVDLQRAPKS